VASVNKQSLREEFEALQARFEQLCRDGQMSADSRALFQAMLTLFRVLMAVFLERRTSKDTTNSSKPSSQTTKDDTTPARPGTHSKGNAPNDATCANSRTVETVELVKVAQCEVCGEDLTDTPCKGHERRSLIDIVFEKVVCHTDVEIKDCPRCATEVKGTFPANLSGPLQYGPGVRAYALNLLIAQMIALKRVQESIRMLIGMVIAEATILKHVMQLHNALEAWERSAIERLLAMPALHVDETSLRVDRKNHWIHVYSADDLTLKFLHPKRGSEAIEDIGIIPRYGGVIIHDCWASYLAYGNCAHGLCGSHLLRELKFIVDADGYAWARNMKRLLQDTCANVSKRKRKKLTEREYKNLQKRYRNILTRGEKEMPPVPVRQNGKRGKIAKSDAHNLWERMKKYEKAVLLFAKQSHVAFTNNRAERDLRMSKVKQKVSGCFRTSQYAQAYCRISSYLQSMATQGYNPLVSIQMALSGQLYADRGE
jgi:transposase